MDKILKNFFERGLGSKLALVWSAEEDLGCAQIARHSLLGGISRNIVGVPEGVPNKMIFIMVLFLVRWPVYG